MVTAERFVGGDGSVRWGALAMTLVGGVWFALSDLFVRLIFGFFGILTGALDGAVRWAVELVETLLGIPSAALLSGWSQLRAIVTSSEAFAFLFALAAVLAMIYGTRWVVTRGAA